MAVRAFRAMLLPQHRQHHAAPLQLAGSIAFGVNVGNLLQLQRALEGDRIGDAAAEILIRP